MTYNPPPPHQPPQGPLGFGPYQGPTHPLGSARRAGIFMFVIGGLLLLCGFGILGAAQKVDWNEMMQRSEQVYGPEFTKQMQTQGVTPGQMRAGVLFWGVVGIVVAFVFIVLGAFVVRGSMGAIVTSIILTSLLMLLNLCPAAIMLMMVPQVGASGVFAAGMLLLPLVVSAAVLFFLVKAARAASPARRMREQLRRQYLETQQQAVQAPVGYGYAPPPGWQQQLPPHQAIGPLPPPPTDQSPPTAPPR